MKLKFKGTYIIIIINTKNMREVKTPRLKRWRKKKIIKAGRVAQNGNV